METYKLAELVAVSIDSWVEALKQLDEKPEFKDEVLKEADEVTIARWKMMDKCPAELENEFTIVADRYNYRFDKNGKIVSFEK